MEDLQRCWSEDQTIEGWFRKGTTPLKRIASRIHQLHYWPLLPASSSCISPAAKRLIGRLLNAPPRLESDKVIDNDHRQWIATGGLWPCLTRSCKGDPQSPPNKYSVVWRSAPSWFVLAAFEFIQWKENHAFVHHSLNPQTRRVPRIAENKNILLWFLGLHKSLDRLHRYSLTLLPLANSKLAHSSIMTTGQKGSTITQRTFQQFLLIVHWI